MIKRSGRRRTRCALGGGLAVAAALAGRALAGEAPAAAGDLEAAPAGPSTDPPPSGFYADLGPGVLLFDAGATVKARGVTLPGATLKLDPDTTLISEFGYRSGHYGVSLTGGLPPEVTIKGAGSLSPLGTLGKLRYGPATLTAHYHFNPSGRFRPYVGAGPVFLVIFKDHDGALQHLNIHANTGVVLQLGAEFATSPRWGLVFDVKKAILRTNASGVLGGAPIAAHIRIDPLVLAAGLSYHF
jgi:outer membrane protein